MTRIVTLILLISLGGLAATAKEMRVGPGDNIEKTLRKARGGDTVYFESGRYSEPLTVRRLKGQFWNPVVLRPAPGAEVVFDGTDALPDNWTEVTPGSEYGARIQSAQWDRIQGKLYAQKLSEPIYALLYKDRLMSDARWPNSRWDDPWRLDRYMALRRAEVNSTRGELYDGLTTDNTLEESSTWLHYDRSLCTNREEMLADTGISFEGGIAVVSHTWGSWGTRITSHAAGTNNFKYDTTFADSGSIREEATQFMNNRLQWKDAEKIFSRSSHSGIQFFLMGLPALDIPEEWWYDQQTGVLYFISPDGERPEPGQIRGKRRDFLLTIEDCEHLRVEGFDFIGAAVLMKDCYSSKIEDCDFFVGSYHKFSVGNFDMPVTTRIENRRTTRKGVEERFSNELVNCTFTYADGNAFEGRSTGLTINNVLIQNTQQTTLGLDSRSMSIDRPSLVRRVTIDGVGASVGIKGGGIDSIYELNNIMHFGGLQYDGASLQMGGRERFIYRYNWSHDHPKRSYRFDAASYPEYANAFGEMSYNVAWNTPGGFAIKGDDHLIHNNLLVGDATFDLFNMKRWASKNERTVVTNNIVQGFFGGSYDWDQPVARKSRTSTQLETSDTFWISETKVPASYKQEGDVGVLFDAEGKRRHSPVLAILKNNYLEPADTVLRDPENLDFRPKPDSVLIDKGHTLTKMDVQWKTVEFTGSRKIEGVRPDIGPYEAGADSYWIPGFKFEHASTPVPPDGSATAKPDCDLMWLGGWKANTHYLYVGFDKDLVAKAEQNSGEFQGMFRGERNIFNFYSDIEAGKTVYWRVDAERNGQITKGDVWQFTVGK